MAGMDRTATWQLAVLVCIVAVACQLTGRRAARLRHWLWILVLLKVFLPPSLTSAVSVGQWGIRPILESMGAERLFVEEGFIAVPEAFSDAHRDDISVDPQSVPNGRAINPPFPFRPACSSHGYAAVFCSGQ